MTYNLPLRRTTLHLAQRFRMDGETFMNSNLLTTSLAVLYGKVLIIHFSILSVQHVMETAFGVKGQSGREDRLR
jgi:hypothetical protein